MGQCTSTKSTQVNNVLYVNRCSNKKQQTKKNKRKSDNNCSPLHCAAKFFKMEKNTKPGKCPSAAATTRGQVTRFGFKKPQPQQQLPSIPASTTDDFTVVEETIQPLVINSIHAKNGTPLPSRGKKDLKPVNRFGFVPPAPQLSNKVSDVNAGAKENARPTAKTTAYRLSPGGGRGRSVSETRFNNTLQPVEFDKRLMNGGGCATTAGAGSVQNLVKTGVGHYYGNRQPSPSSPVYYKSNESLVASPSADKLAKTAANNHMVYRSQNRGLSFGYPNSTVKLQRNDSKMEIQQLEHSPGAATKFRHQERARPMEMVFPSDRNGGGVRKFELRDVPPPPPTTTSHQEQQSHGRLAERIRREVVMPAAAAAAAAAASAGVDMTRSVEDELSSEEKQRRDKKDSEKFQKPSLEDDNNPMEEDLWGGPGEAMALEDEFPCPTLAAIDHSPEAMNPPLRSVLLTIEDPTFAALAAISKPGMIDDEQPPESPDISCSSPSSIEPLPPPPANITTPGSKTATPQSPGTPSHASNSLSSDAKDRDFLIDDEIADQPGLVFDGERLQRRLDEREIRTSKRIAALAGEVSQALANLSCSAKDHPLRASNASLASTLSPCESLASDDLMVDFDQSELSLVDDLDRDDAPYKSEVLKQSDQVIKEWSTLLNSYPRLAAAGKRKSRPALATPSSRSPKIDAEPKLTTAGDTTTTSSSQSPAARSYASSPVGRTAKIKNASSPVADDISDDSGVGKGVYQSMYQDFVYIKSGLRLLQKVLQESTDFGQPLQSSGEEGLELEDLRRQMLLLELENQEKDRRILKLEEELKAAREAKRPPSLISSSVTANKATQTDKVRPLSTTFFHNSPNNTTASIVSLNESSKEQQINSVVNRVGYNNLRCSGNNYPTNRKFV